MLLLAMLLLSAMAAATAAILAPLIAGLSLDHASLMPCEWSLWPGVHARSLRQARLIPPCARAPLAGRQLLQALRVPLRHDMYVFAAGMYTLWALGRVASWLCRMAGAADMSGALP